MEYVILCNLKESKIRDHFLSNPVQLDSSTVRGGDSTLNGPYVEQIPRTGQHHKPTQTFHIL